MIFNTNYNRRGKNHREASWFFKSVQYVSVSMFIKICFSETRLHESFLCNLFLLINEIISKKVTSVHFVCL